MMTLLAQAEAELVEQAGQAMQGYSAATVVAWSLATALFLVIFITTISSGARDDVNSRLAYKADYLERQKEYLITKLHEKLEPEELGNIFEQLERIQIESKRKE